MKINISGHHVEVTNSVREHIEEKFSKIASHFPTLVAIDTILSKVHGKHHVELSTNYEGVRIAIAGTDPVMYPAIASATKKLDAALKHRKGLLKANLHVKPVSTSEEIAHEKVQSLDLA
ncbi:ribosome hibernation-promoting factor, HPF/YfiA family [Thalassotalea piscium]|uniref:Ribosomal subunit interface protein n=1 Tax=Thalassotalea piscium TaxID=1230533 RepID=A0A7X0TUW1_9GAMM|nr:ribosome-associated translation inhibitor RaiA [Thalassotalea piscium]MBB6544500.1 ribosomal subunit interface protein [Thalassotalea piscium]